MNKNYSKLINVEIFKNIQFFSNLLIFIDDLFIDICKLLFFDQFF